MRGAWCEYDVAMHLATRYKVISKLLFFTSLMVAWAMVLVGVATLLATRRKTSGCRAL